MCAHACKDMQCWWGKHTPECQTRTYLQLAGGASGLLEGRTSLWLWLSLSLSLWLWWWSKHWVSLLTCSLKDGSPLLCFFKRGSIVPNCHSLPRKTHSLYFFSLWRTRPEEPTWLVASNSQSLLRLIGTDMKYHYWQNMTNGGRMPWDGSPLEIKLRHTYTLDDETDNSERLGRNGVYRKTNRCTAVHSDKWWFPAYITEWWIQQNE